MTPRPAARRYLIRCPDGRELVCPGLGDLQALYSQGFLDDGDLVKVEGASDWVPAGRLPALAGAREAKRDPRKVLLLLVAAAALSLGLWLLLRR
jgi:hypothetical protein